MFLEIDAPAVYRYPSLKLTIFNSHPKKLVKQFILSK
jgi:hypothetical protein